LDAVGRNAAVTPQATAFAPASVGNVGVGFDILGHTIAGPGDRVTVRRIAERTVHIAAVRGCETALPTDAARNTAGAALIALRDALALPFGFEIEIDKGLPYGAGMGGSAASAVAALVAANALLDRPLARRALYPFALDGEAVASGGHHGDNVGPMLLGGLVLATKDSLVSIPVPAALSAVLVHPHAVVETRAARAALAGPYDLAAFVAQSANLALLIAGCFAGDFALIRRGLDDVLIEPRRSALIPGFAAVKQAALDAGALGASISGAGPSVFAWCEGDAIAQQAARAMRDAFAAASLDSDGWISPVAGPAAEVVACAT
jgi:homoserine kinase